MIRPVRNPEVPLRRVLRISQRQTGHGSRHRMLVHLHLECGHVVRSAAAGGRASRVRCTDCWHRLTTAEGWFS